ncbi:phytanoyl-CoA dioxygenase family protein [Nodularia sp. UHCC 0506]|uniref:phytanoyl-CoA dioxygenase family protein n=1 Tax=Nodularia sp. UHCC 0506 TaxID=3110243 RepID=UPI002B20636D|nr:phytanoyl-CoA dioxygenase family protein [Nodularia sp. UHCC 0506]MEA5516919.1 phytanoyl-CoA dioxygenase family protein [Nodularia sp. UHCC 0506]
MIQAKLAYTSDNPKLDYRVIIRKILTGKIGYIFGRFYLCRLYYSKFKRIKQLFFSKNKIDTSLNFDTQILNNSHIDIEEISSHIRHDSYYAGLELNQQSVTSIVSAAKTKNLIVSANGLSFQYSEYQDKIKPHHKIATAEVGKPLEIKEVYQLRYDSYLLQIASQYLGYFPTNCDVKLWWSFADNLSLEERRRQFQTIDYHYDIHGFNFFYISFYLTNVDEKSGAHMLVKGSHVNKKMSMLLRSARVPEELITQNYSQNDIITIEGKAGKCFLEDASCFHKALPPIEKDRLLLQLRYF